MAPERPNSPQEETVLTPKMSVPGSPVAGTPVREAQSPMSILLAVAQSQNRNDDDLTNLNWLHERDLLKGMNINPSPSSSVNSTPVKSYNEHQFLISNSPTTEYSEESTSDSSNTVTNTFIINTNTTPVYHQNGLIQQRAKQQQQQQQALNIPYDPQIHTNNKPPYSFSCLIFMAIEDSVQKALPVKMIYAWILDHFPYFKNAPTGWKNSVRHNLSLNKCFQKVEKAPNLGKGSLWTVDPQYKPNLIQALNRSPFHHCSTIEQPHQTNGVRQVPVESKERTYRLPNPELFPYLAKKLASVPDMKYGNTNVNVIVKKEEDSLNDVDAAAVMLSLRNGTNYRREKGFWQVITTSPSQDHTYSAADNVQAPDKDSSLELEDRIPKSTICRKIDFEDEEERKIKEGAETLLNLASVTLLKREITTPTHEHPKRMKTESEFDVNDYERTNRVTMEPEFDVNENTPTEKSTSAPAPFKPRLLRVKIKEHRKKMPLNNNNSDEWVKLRREIEKQQNR